MRIKKRIHDPRSGPMKFWYGSGSVDPCLWLMDPDSDPDPAIFVKDLQDANKKKKKSKRSHKTVRIKFFYYFCLMIEGWYKDPDPDPHLWLMDPDPGGPKTCGSGGSGFGSGTLKKKCNNWQEIPFYLLRPLCTGLFQYGSKTKYYKNY
jgi:hypothetical protein